jgi:hypothetical protein
MTNETLTEELECHAKLVMPDYPNDVCSRAKLEIERLEAENERLRAGLKQALGQWSMYADMVERSDGFDLKNEKSLEADEYRRLLALSKRLHDEQSAAKEGK